MFHSSYSRGTVTPARGEMHIPPCDWITPLDHPNPPSALMLFFLAVAVVVAALTTRDAFPQLTNLLRSADVRTHL